MSPQPTLAHARYVHRSMQTGRHTRSPRNIRPTRIATFVISHSVIIRHNISTTYSRSVEGHRRRRRPMVQHSQRARRDRHHRYRKCRDSLTHTRSRDRSVKRRHKRGNTHQGNRKGTALPKGEHVRVNTRHQPNNPRRNVQRTRASRDRVGRNGRRVDRRSTPLVIP